MQDFLTAVALVLVIEGAIYALCPDGMKRMMEQVMPIPSGTLRTAGLIAACGGVFFLWLIRG